MSIDCSFGRVDPLALYLFKRRLRYRIELVVRPVRNEMTSETAISFLHAAMNMRGKKRRKKMISFKSIAVTSQFIFNSCQIENQTKGKPPKEKKRIG